MPKMKQLAYIILTFFILSSCSNEKSSSTNNDTKQIDSLKQNFIPIFNGIWVLTDYIDGIEQTKSPLKSADKLQGIVTMIINETNPSDSIEVGLSWNNHEGDHFTIYLLPGLNRTSLKTNIIDYDKKSNFYELGYETINNEVFLFLYHYNKVNRLIDKKRFSKVADKQPDDDAAWGLQYLVNQKLFSGKYLLIDSLNSTTKINLKNDGSLTGHPGFKTYYVLTDFIGEPEMTFDGVVFNLQTQNSKSFAFKKANDTIYLFSMIGDVESGDFLKLGKIQYKLVRQ